MKAFQSVVALLILTFSISATFAQQTTLEPGKAIDKTISADETHSYTLTLASGLYGLLRVDQKGTNLAVSVLSVDGQKLRHADLDGAGVPEQLSLVAKETTQYRIEVTIAGRLGKTHGYTITLSDVRPATDQDRARVEGEKLLEDGMRLLYEQSAQSARLEAVDKFQQAINFFRTAKDQDKEAQALFLSSNTFILLAEFPKAQAAAEQGLPLAQASGNKHIEAYLLDELGSSFNYRGERKKALDFYLRALSLRSQAKPVGLAHTMNNVAMVYSWIGEPRKALVYMEQAIAMLDEAGDLFKQASILSNMCVINSDLGQYKDALTQCNRALEIKREFKDLGGQAIAFSSLGRVYGFIGDYQKALDFFQQQRALSKSLNDREGEALASNNVGWAYAQFGEYEKAIEFYSQAVQPFREQGNKYGLAQSLGNIAASYANLNDFHKALEMHLQVLPLRSEKDDPNGKAVTLNNIALCYSKLGDKPKALEYYTEALALNRVSQNQRQLAITLRNFGTFLREESQTSKAREYLNEARTISRTIGDRGTQASLLFELAQLERDLGNLVDAGNLIEQATDTIESVRINLKSQQLRTSFLASVRKYYEFQIELLMTLHQQRPNEGFNAKALQISEKSRARSLLELLREARAEIRQGVEPSLIEREESLRRLIAEKAEEQTRLLSARLCGKSRSCDGRPARRLSHRPLCHARPHKQSASRSVGHSALFSRRTGTDAEWFSASLRHLQSETQR
jgi:tetratricopeptide (TPR) repeat protein